jgi:hypothetical protein
MSEYVSEEGEIAEPSVAKRRLKIFMTGHRLEQTKDGEESVFEAVVDVPADGYAQFEYAKPRQGGGITVFWTIPV